jgi:hypothetical protein
MWRANQSAFDLWDAPATNNYVLQLYITSMGMCYIRMPQNIYMCV